MTIMTKALLALALVLALAFSVQTWRVGNARRAGVEAALAPAKEAAIIATAKVETVTVTLAAAEKVVTRVLTQVRTDTLMLSPQTAQDTATALVQLPALAAAHDTLQRACTELMNNCTAYRLAAVAKFRADSAVIAKYAAIVDERPMTKHWLFGVTGGYGIMPHAGQVFTGPSLTAGITWTPFN
jgi:hypothetical protein